MVCLILAFFILNKLTDLTKDELQGEGEYRCIVDKRGE